MSDVKYVSTGSSMSAIWFLVGALCSWMINHSVMWAIIHGFFGFFYVLYLCLGFGGGFEGVEAGIGKTFSQPETIQE